MTKPFIIFAPGSFAPPGLYQNMIDGAKAKGLDIKGLHLPSIGDGPGLAKDAPPASMYDDAAFIAKEVEAVADTGRDVILVSHSYGGMPATQSTKGLSKKEREAQGKKGGLVRLGYQTALVGKSGQCAAQVLGDSQGEPNMVPQESGYLHIVSLERMAGDVFNDHPLEEGVRLSGLFSQHSAQSFGDAITHEGYKDVPVSYLHCTNDLCVTVPVQKGAIEMIEKETGTRPDVTDIDSGHFPSAGHADDVVDWLVALTEK